MDKLSIESILKYVIWCGLAVIIFSPLYVNTAFFFPFIVTKTLAFNISVQVILLAFLFLSWRDDKYKININIVVALFGMYLIFSFISSLLGDNFYKSFWSNNERSEGLLLYTHLFLFLVVVSSFLKKLKDWLLAFDLLFLSSLLVAVLGSLPLLGIESILLNSGGDRLSSTIGNAGYMAGFLIFSIFIGCFLFYKRNDFRLRFYYFLVILFEMFIVMHTETRGAILALGVTGIGFLIYISFFYFKNKRYKLIGSVLLGIVVLLSVLVFINRDSDFVKDSRVLRRVSSISIQDTTTQNRLMTWESAFKGFRERPFLGWGLESFYQPFDKYFNPQIYRHTNSVVWFDRAHNIIFDRLVSGGMVGLLSYLLFLFVPLYYCFKYFRNKKEYFIPVVFSLLLVAYFIQNLFIFEALVIYIPLFLSLAFLGMFSPKFGVEVFNNYKVKTSLLVLWTIGILPMMYVFIVKPVSVNAKFVKALADNSQNLSVQKRFNNLENILAENTYGNQEYRQQYFNFFANIVNRYRGTDDQNARQALMDISKDVEKELTKQLEENPNNALNYVLMMKFNNLAYIYDLNRLNNNVEIFSKAVALSPERPQIYYEMAYTYFYLGNYFLANKEEEKSKQAFDLTVSNFKKVIDLNDQNTEPYKQLIQALVNMNRKDEALKYYTLLQDLPNYQGHNWADEIIKDLK